jgi:hypothetical protein
MIYCECCIWYACCTFNCWKMQICPTFSILLGLIPEGFTQQWQTLGGGGQGGTVVKGRGNLKLLISTFLPCCVLVDVEHSHVRFLGNLVLNLWDCGG